MNRKLGVVATWVIIIAVIVGGFGADLESMWAMRVANGAIALTFAGLGVREAVRAKTRVAVLVVFGLLGLLFGYLTYNVWPSEPIYAVIGLIVDFL